ncbi:MAG TPA: hypothetical protein VF301_09340 [Ginsengibacter sp.]|jgi:hypothetical protein
MSEQQSTITQDIENLFKKTTEANKLFLTESVKFVKQLSSSKIKGEELFTTQKQLLKDAVNLFVKLNIQYTSNLIDLGVAVTKRLNQNLNTKENSSSEQRDSSDNKPAFVLNISGAAGETVTAQFLLDSNKEEPVICNLKQTEYTFENDPSVKEIFETTFNPQSFEILQGQSQKVDINIKIPDDVKEGVYLSNIQVDGFEHTFFSLYITVTSPNASK